MLLICAAKPHWSVLWPGTLAHELCHLTVGFLLSARPTRFTVIPRGDCLGEVTFRGLNAINTLPTALAPLLIIPLLLAIWPWLSLQQGWLQIILAWITASATLMSLPSRQDLALIGQEWMGSLAWIMIAIGVVRLI